MNERVKIQRGLVRLYRTTAEQLADFAGAEPTTVRNFLNTPGLCMKEHLPSSGGETTRTVWVLMDEGREKILAELRSFSSTSDPELEQERLDGLKRIKLGIAELEQEIAYLEASRDQDDNILDTEIRIRERLSALSVGLQGLSAWRDQPNEVWRLSNLRGRLDQACR